MGKFTMRIKKIGTKDSEAWDEEMEFAGITDAELAREKAQEIVDRFKATLRKGEVERVLVDVTFVEELRYSRRHHTWVKVSLVTEAGMYDRMKCEVCGITAKRYGIGAGHPIRDPKYSADIYARCDTALKHIKREELAKKRNERLKAKRAEYKRRTFRARR